MNEITPEDAGTWLDGSQGWHNNYRVIERAQAYGFQPEGLTEEDVDKLIGAYSGDDDEPVTLSTGETVSAEDIAGWVIDQGGLSDEATDYLQSLAPDGYEFVWDMGELSLVSSEDAEQF